MAARGRFAAPAARCRLALLEELMEAQKEAEGKQSAAAARKEVLRCGSSALGQLVPPLLQLCSEAAQLHLQSWPSTVRRLVWQSQRLVVSCH